MEEKALVEKQPLVMEKINYLDKEIARLFEVIFSLKIRLKPVLVPEVPSPRPESEKEEKISPNLISQILQEEIDSIITLQGQIKEIQKRLEI